MHTSSSTHLLLIPSYNPGDKGIETVRAALAEWSPVWVVVDGSDDGSAQAFERLAQEDARLKVMLLPRNSGKGAAVLAGIEQALQQGFTHVLTMDSDGQHPAHLIQSFMAESMRSPHAMILGCPVFDEHAPLVRVYGRKLSNAVAALETVWAGVGDSLFGFRVYPILPLYTIMRQHYWMRRFDFDPEAVVRLCWYGVKPVNLAAPVRYPSADEGGVSHFNYWRDNALLTWMHFRLLLGGLLRLPCFIARWLAGPAPGH